MLRVATADVHERLHGHNGLAAVKSGTIDLPRYRLLLQRLHGFYVPFEAAAGLPPLRSVWLARDLAALGVVPAEGAAAVPAFITPAAQIGALYVVEGAALGGHGLAKSLGKLLGRDAVAGRRFFACDGADPGASWRAFVIRLGDIPAAAHPQAATAAVAAFAVFESWVGGWEATDA